MNKHTATILLLASAMAISACAKKAPAELPPVADEEVIARDTPIDTRPDNRTPDGPGTQVHFERAVGGSTTVYFDTDRFNIDATDQAALQAQAQYFARFPQLTFTIQGHADERGTREYNLALGEQRANAARNYLVSVGVAANRIRTVSYGKERPVALGSDEQSWAQNRRAASVMIDN